MTLVAAFAYGKSHGMNGELLDPKGSKWAIRNPGPIDFFPLRILWPVIKFTAKAWIYGIGLLRTLILLKIGYAKPFAEMFLKDNIFYHRGLHQDGVFYLFDKVVRLLLVAISTMNIMNSRKKMLDKMGDG